MKLLVLGRNGRLGAALARQLAASHPVTALGRAEFDLAAGDDALRRVLDAQDFEVLLNAAGATNVDACERDPALAAALNEHAVASLARICRDRGARIVHFSTDYVLDGTAIEPVAEDVEPQPISVYGRTKLAGERAVLEADASHLVARVSWLFGPDKASFPDAVLHAARSGGTIRAISDKWSTPTSCEDIAVWMLRLLARGLPRGVLHVCNAGGCSWLDYARAVVAVFEEGGGVLRCDPLIPTPLAAMTSFLAPRPPYTVLATQRLASALGSPPRAWKEAVRDYILRAMSPPLPSDRIDDRAAPT